MAWLAEDHGLGHGHAMAFYGALENGPDAVPDKHVGATGSHRDECTTLRLDGSGKVASAAQAEAAG